jgi:hypothetical protein
VIQLPVVSFQLPERWAQAPEPVGPQGPEPIPPSPPGTDLPGPFGPDIGFPTPDGDFPNERPPLM